MPSSVCQDCDQALVARDDVKDVLAHYQAAYFALGPLGDVVENLRVLSLNAELAAGRAGPLGLSIKVATQATRELVTQLKQTNDRMNNARYRCYRFGALAMRGLPRVARFGRTLRLIQSLNGAYGASGIAALEQAIHIRSLDAAKEMAGLVEGGAELRKFAHNLDRLVTQAAAIATTLAVEAVHVRGHQQVFMLVAAAMKRNVDQLRDMVGEAARHIQLGNTAANAVAGHIQLIREFTA